MLNLDFYGMFDYDAAGGETYEYTSEEFSSLIEGVTGNGISTNYLNEFAPTANGLDISVASGAAFIKGRWGYNSTAKTISLSPTTSTQKRIDRIVIELDVASRAIGLNTLVGTATTGTPTAPTLADNQLAICSVLVANGSNTTLTDERVFTYSAADVQKQLNEIKAKIGNLAFLPLSGGTMTGDIDFGNAANSGIQWTTDNGTRIRIRPYSPANVFQITMKPSGGDEFGALNMDTSGNITLAQPLPIANGGTGATTIDAACANIGALRYKQYDNGYFETGAANGSAWLQFQVNGTIKCQMDLFSDGKVGIGGKTVLVAGDVIGYAKYNTNSLSMDSWIDNNAYTLMLRDGTTDKCSLAMWPGGVLTVNGSIVATEGRDNTFAGTLTVSNTKSAGGYVKIWEDNEGGNIAIGSPNGKEFQIDAFDNTVLRCYSYDDRGNIKGFNFDRRNGNFSADGDFYSRGQRVADVQHGSLDVGTSGKTITFPHAFAGIPSVTATGSKFCHLYVKDITATGCTLVSGESNNHVQWIAAY